MDKYSKDVDLGTNQNIKSWNLADKQIENQSRSSKVERQKLKEILEKKEELVCQKMHKAMSPINAISGYLDLMKMLLDEGDEKELLKHYREKVEEGIDELEEIVEDLYEAFAHKNGKTV